MTAALANNFRYSVADAVLWEIYDLEFWEVLQDLAVIFAILKAHLLSFYTGKLNFVNH